MTGEKMTHEFFCVPEANLSGFRPIQDEAKMHLTETDGDSMIVVDQRFIDGLQKRLDDPSLQGCYVLVEISGRRPTDDDQTAYIFTDPARQSTIGFQFFAYGKTLEECTAEAPTLLQFESHFLRVIQTFDQFREMFAIRTLN